jgi:hypothetical protein
MSHDENPGGGACHISPVVAGIMANSYSQSSGADFSYCAIMFRPTGRNWGFEASCEIVSTNLQTTAEEKLGLLKQFDRWRRWRSLDEKRLCLGCGRLFTGHEVEVSPEAGDDAPAVHCPTHGCQSIPLDWILPNPRTGDTNA